MSEIGLMAALVLAGPPPECKPLSAPKRLPAVDQVVDEARLGERMAGLEGVPPGELVLSIVFGESPSVHVVGDPSRDAGHDAVRGMVLASLRPAAKDPPAAIRFIVTPGAAPIFRVDRSVLCDPEPDQTAGPAGGSARGTVRVTGPMPLPRDIRSVRARIRIGISGEVTEAKLVSGSGFPEVDRTFLDMVRANRYRPALLDGRPVEVWLNGTRVELVPVR